MLDTEDNYKTKSVSKGSKLFGCSVDKIYLDGVGSRWGSFRIRSQMMINTDHTENSRHTETPFAQGLGKFLGIDKKVEILTDFNKKIE